MSPQSDILRIDPTELCRLRETIGDNSALEQIREMLMIAAARRTLAAGATLLAIAVLARSALANQHPHPHKGSLDYLDRNSYARNMRVIGVFQLGEERGHKLQMMAMGARRFILQNGDVI